MKPVEIITSVVPTEGFEPSLHTRSECAASAKLGYVGVNNRRAVREDRTRLVLLVAQVSSREGEQRVSRCEWTRTISRRLMGPGVSLERSERGGHEVGEDVCPKAPL